MMSRAGSSGSRRRHGSLSWKRVTFGWIEGVISGRIVVLMASAVPVFPVVRQLAAGCLRCDVLAVLQRRVDRRPSGDHGGELLGALVSDVLELRDADVLHAGQPGALCRAGVVDRRG